MPTAEELYEMGWNDVAGNLRRAADASTDQKKTWTKNLLAGNIRLPRKEDGYLDGAKAAATAFLDGDKLEFKGPKDVVADLERLCPSFSNQENPTEAT